MRRKFAAYLLWVLFPCFLWSQENQEATAILGKVTSFHKSHPKMMGDFSLSIDGKVQTGVFYYNTNSNAQSVKLFFGPPDMDTRGQEKFSYWVVDKNKLWVYLSDSKVLVEQEIPDYFRTIGILGAGLSHYFAEYKDFSVKEIKDKDNNGKDIFVKILTFSEPVKEKTAFSKVSLEITDDGFQRATLAVSNSENQKDKKVNFAFRLSNVDLNPDFDENQIFRIVPGGNMQILRNVLMSGS